MYVKIPIFSRVKRSFSLFLPSLARSSLSPSFSFSEATWHMAVWHHWRPFTLHMPAHRTQRVPRPKAGDLPATVASRGVVRAARDPQGLSPKIWPEPSPFPACSMYDGPPQHPVITIHPWTIGDSPEFDLSKRGVGFVTVIGNFSFIKPHPDPKLVWNDSSLRDLQNDI